ncbi:MAG: two-component regulator propeller domain-containing protein [Candidatus Wallbacteria bacterium]|nr:two-component regulator propeller domain-containing protein [Candidatus Wallbacteria bacterium]
MKRFCLQVFFFIFLISACSPEKSARQTGAEKTAAEPLKSYFNRNSGLAENHVLCLFSDPDGTLWIGTTNGIYTLKDGVIAPLDGGYNERLTSARINCIGSNGGSTLYIGTDEELVIWDNRMEFKIRQTGRVNCVHWSSSRGMLYAGTDFGIVTFQHGQWGSIDKENSSLSIADRDDNLGQNLLRILSIAEDKDGTLWFGTGDGLVKFSGDIRVFYGKHKRPSADGSISVMPGNSSLGGNIVNRVLIDGERKIIASSGGVNVFTHENSTWNTYTAKHRELESRGGEWVDIEVEGNSLLAGNWVNDIAVWKGWTCIATTGGLSFYNEGSNRWISYKKDQGIVSERLTRLVVHQGKVFAGSEYGLYAIDLSGLPGPPEPAAVEGKGQ